ncbi:MAG: outer membrane beta-barrel protein [Ferruginibacter sp.]
MQHLSNDMDELFKRAGENYPLGAGNGDWDSVANKIAGKVDTSKIIHQKSWRKSRFLFFGLFLLLLAVYWMFTYLTPAKKTKQDNVTVLAKPKKVTIDNPVKYNQQAVNHSKEEAFSTDGRTYNSLDSSATIEKEKTNNPLTSSSKRNESSPENSIPDIVPDIPTQSLAWPNDTEETIPVRMAIDGNIFVGSDALKARNVLPLITPPLQMFAGNLLDTTKDVYKEPSKQNKKEIKSRVQKKHLYIGLMVGADVSKVESMPFSYTGMNAGIIAGLYINPKLSFETGIGRSRKYYNSEGKSFSMVKVASTMPRVSTINDLEGESSLIEIPLKLKYNLVNKTKSTFFVSAGISSYIVTHEKNKYKVTLLNGNHEKMTGIYDKSSYSLPAVVNFSIGYEHRLTRHLQIRAEPFLKIPIKGMGVGKLPITSSGLQMVLTRRRN